MFGYRMRIVCMFAEKFVCAVTIRGHTYGCADHEDRHNTRGIGAWHTTNSYFRMHGSHQQPTEHYHRRWFYGRILHWARFAIGTMEVRCAAVRIYHISTTQKDERTGLDTVKIGDHNVYASQGYISLNHIDAPIMLAPHKSEKLRQSHTYYAMLTTSDPALGSGLPASREEDERED